MNSVFVSKNSRDNRRPTVAIVIDQAWDLYNLLPGLPQSQGRQDSWKVESIDCRRERAAKLSPKWR